MIIPIYIFLGKCKINSIHLHLKHLIEYDEKDYSY